MPEEHYTHQGVYSGHLQTSLKTVMNISVTALLGPHKPPYLYVEALDKEDGEIRILFDTTGRLLLHTIPDAMVPDLFWTRCSTILLGRTFEPQYPEYYSYHEVKKSEYTKE